MLCGQPGQCGLPQTQQTPLIVTVTVLLLWRHTLLCLLAGLVPSGATAADWKQPHVNIHGASTILQNHHLLHSPLLDIRGSADCSTRSGPQKLVSMMIFW